MKIQKNELNDMLHLFYFRSASNAFCQVKQLPEPNWFLMWLLLAASWCQSLQICPLLCHFFNEFNKNSNVTLNNMLHLFYFNVYFQRVLSSKTAAGAKLISYVAAFGCILMAIPPILSPFLPLFKWIQRKIKVK